MGMPTLTEAERAIRRAVNPLSTAVTRVVQGAPRRRITAGGSVAPRGDWGPPEDDGGAGVREPRRPLPTPPSMSQALDLPD